MNDLYDLSKRRVQKKRRLKVHHISSDPYDAGGHKIMYEVSNDSKIKKHGYDK